MVSSLPLFHHQTPLIIPRGILREPSCSSCLSCYSEHSRKVIDDISRAKRRKAVRFEDEDASSLGLLDVEFHSFTPPTPEETKDLYFNAKEIHKMRVHARFAAAEFSVMNANDAHALERSFELHKNNGHDDDGLERALFNVAVSDDVRGLERYFSKSIRDNRGKHVKQILAVQQNLQSLPSPPTAAKLSASLAARSLSSSRQCRMLALKFGQADEQVARNIDWDAPESFRVQI